MTVDAITRNTGGNRTSMTPRDGCHEPSMLNTGLMKLTGLYQLLDPDAPTVFGRNRYRVAGALVAAYLALEMAVCAESAYYSLDRPTRCVKYAMLLFATSLMLSKVCFVLRNADELWRLASVASDDFLSRYGGHRADIAAGGRAATATVTGWTACAWTAISAMFALSPVLRFGRAADTADGGRYRDSILNLVFPVTDAFYRDNYAIFYALESATLVCYAYALVNHDCLVTSIAVAIAHQLKTIATSYGQLGRGDEYANEKKHSLPTDEQSAFELNELILIIEDHQKFTKIMHEIYRLIRTNVLMQLAIESMLITLQPFLFISNANTGFSLESFELITVSMAHLAHLFLTCYLFCRIDSIKDSMHFALYDCNWTDMSMDFRKLLLLTMQMNDAEKLRMKGSTRTVVNLELFTRVIHTTYKIVSVLVN